MRTKVGTWATLRVVYLRPDGVLQLVDIVVSHADGPTTAAQRTAAAAWMERQYPTLETAVIRLRQTVPTKGRDRHQT